MLFREGNVVYGIEWGWVVISGGCLMARLDVGSNRC